MFYVLCVLSVNGLRLTGHPAPSKRSWYVAERLQFTALFVC